MAKLEVKKMLVATLLAGTAGLTGVASTDAQACSGSGCAGGTPNVAQAEGGAGGAGGSVTLTEGRRIGLGLMLGGGGVGAPNPSSGISLGTVSTTKSPFNFFGMAFGRATGLTYTPKEVLDAYNKTQNCLMANEVARTTVALVQAQPLTNDGTGAAIASQNMFSKCDVSSAIVLHRDGKPIQPNQLQDGEMVTVTGRVIKVPVAAPAQPAPVAAAPVPQIVAAPVVAASPATDTLACQKRLDALEALIKGSGSRTTCPVGTKAVTRFGAAAANACPAAEGIDCVDNRGKVVKSVNSRLLPNEELRKLGF